jgi:hypothetical protein
MAQFFDTSENIKESQEENSTCLKQQEPNKYRK